jgi:hypothetical protein
LTREDLVNESRLASLARVSGLPAQDFQRRFAGLIGLDLKELQKGAQ